MFRHFKLSRLRVEVHNQEKNSQHFYLQKCQKWQFSAGICGNKCKGLLSHYVKLWIPKTIYLDVIGAFSVGSSDKKWFEPMQAGALGNCRELFY